VGQLLVPCNRDARDRGGIARDPVTDHDPDALDARADRLDAVARDIEALAQRRSGLGGIVVELRDAAALLRRLADDVRLLNRFLRAVNLLGGDDARTEADD
jgi:hypothetical protein